MSSKYTVSNSTKFKIGCVTQKQKKNSKTIWMLVH